MQPPDWVQDAEFAAFLQRAAAQVEATMRAQSIQMPPGVGQQFCQAALAYLRDHPLAEPKTFYAFSGSRLVAIVQALEDELAGGHANPAFNEILGRRLRDAMEELGGHGSRGASD